MSKDEAAKFDDNLLKILTGKIAGIGDIKILMELDKFGRLKVFLS